MHPIIIVSALLAIRTAASPLEKRELVRVYETVTDVSTVTKIVTVPAPGPTPIVNANDNNDQGGNPRFGNRRVDDDDRPRLRVWRTTITVGAQPQVPPTPAPEPVPEQTPPQEQPRPPPQAPVVENSPTPTPTPTPTPEPQPQPQPSTERVSSGGSGPSDPYQKTALDIHNECRAKHSSPALTWSDELTSIAKEHAETCIYEHRMDMRGVNYGQNIAAGGQASDIKNIIGRQFYADEVPLYQWFGGEPAMGDFVRWGHFSQIVWAETSEVGCYTADCRAKGLGGKLLGGSTNIGKHMTVCNYLKRGNMGGQYAKNVKAPTS